MSNSHTPGPWRVVVEPAGPWVYAGDLAICVASDEEFDQANARLIAQAPAMYDAIKEFVRRVEVGEIRSRKTYTTMKAILEEIDQ